MRKRLYHGRVTALSNSVDIVQTGSPWQQGNITVDFVAGFSVTNALTIWHTSSAVSHNKRYSSIAALTLKAHNYQLLIYIWGQRSPTVNLCTLVPPSELFPTVTHAVVYSPYLILMSDRGWIHNALHNSFHNFLHNALPVVFSILTSGCSSDDPSFYRNLSYFLSDPPFHLSLIVLNIALSHCTNSTNTWHVIVWLTVQALSLCYNLFNVLHILNK